MQGKCFLLQQTSLIFCLYNSVFFTGILTEMLTVLRSSSRNASTMRVSSSQPSKTSGRNDQMNLSSTYGTSVGILRKVNSCERCLWEKLKKQARLYNFKLHFSHFYCVFLKVTVSGFQVCFKILCCLVFLQPRKRGQPESVIQMVNVQEILTVMENQFDFN